MVKSFKQKTLNKTAGYCGPQNEDLALKPQKRKILFVFKTLFFVGGVRIFGPELNGLFFFGYFFLRPQSTEPTEARETQPLRCAVPIVQSAVVRFDGQEPWRFANVGQHWRS